MEDTRRKERHDEEEDGLVEPRNGSRNGSSSTEIIEPFQGSSRRTNVSYNERSRRSRSTATVTSTRKRELELQAIKKRGAVQKQLLEKQAELQIKMINEQLAVDLADVEEETEDLRTIITRRTQNRRKEEITKEDNVQRWLDSHNTEEDGHSQSSYRSVSAKGSNMSFEKSNRSMLARTSRQDQDIWKGNQQKDHFQYQEETRGLLQRVSVGKNLPTFEGDVLEWSCFKRAFEETTKRGGFSEEENLLRLYESLKGNAKEAVSSLMITTRDTRQIMQLLELRFGNPNAVASRIIEDIRSLPNIYNNNGELIVFATKVRNCVAALEAANHTGYLHSPELQREITKKMPYAMVYNYNRYLHEQGTKNEPALVTLSKFIFYEAELACKAGTFEPTSNPPWKRENSQNKNRNSTTQQDNTRNNKRAYKRPWEQVHTTSEKNEDSPLEPKRNKSNKNCTYCDQQSHSIESCEKFGKISVSDRWTWARKKGICFRCLSSSSHLQDQCQESTCKVSNCQLNHHVLLHRHKSNTVANLQISESNKNSAEKVNTNHGGDSQKI